MSIPIWCGPCRRIFWKNHSAHPDGASWPGQDIARGVLFLIADEADFVTGSTLSINGGQHMY